VWGTKRACAAGEAGTIMSYQSRRSVTPVQAMDVAAFAAYTDISATVAESLAERRHLPAGCFLSATHACPSLPSPLCCKPAVTAVVTDCTGCAQGRLCRHRSWPSRSSPGIPT
jgi:hypothetical protein